MHSSSPLAVAGVAVATVAVLGTALLPDLAACQTLSEIIELEHQQKNQQKEGAPALFPEIETVGTRDCRRDLDVLNDAVVVTTPGGERLDLFCNMTYNPCPPGSEFRYRDPQERIANFGPIEITCGTRQLLGCDPEGCLTEITMAEVGLQVNGTMDLLSPLPSLRVLDIDGYCEFGASVGGICISEFNGTLHNFVRGVSRDLEYLSMRGTYLEGDASVLADLPNLKHLDLYGNMEISGDLNPALAGAKGMEYLNLMSTCTSLDLEAVGGLKDLVFLNLHAWGAEPPRKGCPMVSGGLNHLSSLDKLEYLDATNWRSEGSLSDLSPLTRLQTLYLADYNGWFAVEGALSDVSYFFMPDLKICELSNIGLRDDDPNSICQVSAKTFRNAYP